MKNNIFKILAGVVGIYHVILGLSALLLPAESMTKITGAILGVVPVADEQFLLVAKFAGVYVLVFGLFTLMLASNPVKHRSLAYPILALFGIRLVNKVLLFGSIAVMYEISTARNIISVLLVALFFFGLLLTMPKKNN
jgi:hypothetical protein